MAEEEKITEAEKFSEVFTSDFKCCQEVKESKKRWGGVAKSFPLDTTMRWSLAR